MVIGQFIDLKKIMNYELIIMKIIFVYFYIINDDYRNYQKYFEFLELNCINYVCRLMDRQLNNAFFMY